MQADYYGGDRVIFSPHIVEYQSVESFITDCLSSDEFKAIFPDANTVEDVQALMEDSTGHRPNGYILYVQGETPDERVERSRLFKEQEIKLNIN